MHEVSISPLLLLFCLICVRYALTKLLPGFEAGGPNTPSNIDPWLIIGDESSIIVGTDRTSCFERNPVALRMEVLCDSKRTNACPSGGVGVYNPGYWGMVWYFHLLMFLKKYAYWNYKLLWSWRDIIYPIKCCYLFYLAMCDVFLSLFQNIEKGKVYKVSLHIRSSDAVSLTVSLTSSDGLQKLAAHTIT